MSREYEVTFKLSGELASSFRRSFSIADGDLKKIGDGAKKLEKPSGKSNLTKPVRDDLTRTKKEMGGLESAAAHMQSKVRNVLMPLTAGLGAGALAVSSFKKSMDFEAQLDSIQAVSGVSASEMKKVHDLALKEGARTKYSALEAAQGMEEMIKAGLSVKQVIDGGLSAALNMAAAGEIGLADSAEIMSTALNAFKKDALEASTVADILAGTANASATGVMELKMSLSQASAVASGVGMSFKDTNIALGVFANNGLKGSDAGTSLKTMLLNLSPVTADAQAEFERLGLTTFNATKALEFLERQGVKPASTATKDIVDAMMTFAAEVQGAKVGSDKANKAFREMAFNAGAMSSEFYDANGNLQSLEHISGALRKALSGLTSEQRQVALKTMFGTDAIRAANILYEEGAEGVKDFNEEMSKVTALDVAKKRMDNAKGAIEQFSGAMETLQISVLEPTLPLIKELALKAADASERFQEWMQTRQAKEFGNVLLGLLKVAPKLLLHLAAGFVAVKTASGINKTVDYVKGLTKVQTAGTGAAQSIGLIGRAATFLTNPVGLAVGAVGLLTAGVIAYKRHNEQARQSLIHMGEDLKTAFDGYSAIQEQTEETQKLTKEYDRLRQKISDSKTPADELTEAKRKLADIESTLLEMYPEIIDKHDLDNGKIREKIGLINEMNEAQREEMRLKLEQTVLEKSGQKEDLAGEIVNLRNDKEKSFADKDRYNAGMVAFTQLENELMQLSKSINDLSPEEYSKKANEILERANEVGKTVGKSFGNIDLIRGTSEQLRNQALDAYDAINKANEELKAAESSYQELYDAELELIQINLGGKIDDQAKKYKDMNQEQKRAFNDALKQVEELNRQMSLLTGEKKINISMIYNEIGRPPTVPSPNPTKSTVLPYADGGFITKPHMGLVGEAGPEAIIPLSPGRRNRAMSLYQSVGKALGVRAFADGGIVNTSALPPSSRSSSSAPVQITHSPSVVIQGNADSSTIRLIEKALEDQNEKFARMIEQYYRQKARVSMSGF